MKEIVDITTKEIIPFGIENLPALVHGMEGSGASFFSISLAVQLHLKKQKLIMFTAYPMAKEEFFAQIGDDKDTVFCLDAIEDIQKAEGFQTIIIKSGDEELLTAFMEEFPSLLEYALFIKNVENIKSLDVVEFAVSHPSIISGDVTKSPFTDAILSGEFKTKALLSTLGSEDCSGLDKYQAKLITGNKECIVSLQ